MFKGLHENQLSAAIEALLFVTDEPVNALTLARVLEIETAEALAGLTALEKELKELNRGIQLREVAGGWRLYTHDAFHELLNQYILSWDTRKLSGAALEVLSIVAYTQPITRAQISAIRGVSSDGSLNTLIERGYVREAGTADTPGNPILYATTRTFLEKYGLSSIKELPNLEEFAPDEKTAQIIRERLGAPSAADALSAADAPSEAAHAFLTVADSPENASFESYDKNMASNDNQVLSSTASSMLGVVDKIDFDQLTFNTDDE